MPGRTPAPRWVELAAAALLASLLAACASSPSTSFDTSGARIAQFAIAEIGKPYRYGGESSARGFDCSGLASFVHAREGLTIPRSAVAQSRSGMRIERRHLRAGDLVFFRFDAKVVNHVGVYIGGGEFVHSPRAGERVQRVKLDAPWFARRFAGATRHWRD